MEQQVGQGTTVVCVNLAPDGQVGGGWGKAHRVAVAEVGEGRVLGWTEHEVAWDVSHDEGTEGSHHARIVRFLREQQAGVVVTGHMGPPMAHTLELMGVRVVLGAQGDARAAVLAAVAQA